MRRRKPEPMSAETSEVGALSLPVPRDTVVVTLCRAVLLCSALAVNPALPFAAAHGAAGGWICRIKVNGFWREGPWGQEAAENGEPPGRAA